MFYFVFYLSYSLVKVWLPTMHILQRAVQIWSVSAHLLLHLVVDVKNCDFFLNLLILKTCLVFYNGKTWSWKEYILEAEMKLAAFAGGIYIALEWRWVWGHHLRWHFDQETTKSEIMGSYISWRYVTRHSIVLCWALRCTSRLAEFNLRLM